MRKLVVPLYLQAPKSVDCGPVCVRMVLSYFGIRRSLAFLQKKLHYDKTGTSSYDNGALLLDEGLRVTAVTANPMLFPPDIVRSLKNKKHLQELITKKSKTTPKYKKCLKTLEKFLEKGGNLIIEIPNAKHVRAAIDAKRPIIALLYGKAMGSNEGTFHFVVVTGYDGKHVFINNPYPKSKRQWKCPMDTFLYAVHSSSVGYIDNATLLIISK
ncbi:hypothetical protein HY416_03970 [Candidatus Kaiserbacteria bacterium]|nr:hypothetical protein [Candidatus Kaiserbacteria bacterium]